MSYLYGCGCTELIDPCGELERVCETAYVRGRLVTHCHNIRLPAKEVCCSDCC
jgi:hypothetical protein